MVWMDVMFSSRLSATDKSEEEEEEDRLDGDRDWSEKLGFLMSGEGSVVSSGCASTVTNTLLLVLVLLLLWLLSSVGIDSEFRVGATSLVTAVLCCSGSVEEGRWSLALSTCFLTEFLA